METIYQVDARGVLLHERPHNGGPLPTLCVRVEPAQVPAGQVARWVSTAPDYLPGFGEDGSGAWTAEADYRKVPLFLVADGSPYSVGAEVNEQTYPGTGALPAWLTDIERPGPFHNWQGGAWVLDEIAKMEADEADLRAARDAAIQSTDWLVIRHRDEVEASMATTLTPEQYADLLTYRQTLRDLPEDPNFPDVELPAPLAFIG